MEPQRPSMGPGHGSLGRMGEIGANTAEGKFSLDPWDKCHYIQTEVHKIRQQTVH